VSAHLVIRCHICADTYLGHQTRFRQALQRAGGIPVGWTNPLEDQLSVRGQAAVAQQGANLCCTQAQELRQNLQFIMVPVSNSFRVSVSKDYLKFSAAHFIAYPGFRERLHGHNYRMSIEVAGDLGPHGYVVDFGIVKKIARRLCEHLDEKFLIPAQSECLAVTQAGDSVLLRYEQDEFRLPQSDVLLLPIVHSSAEELARYLVGEMRRELMAEGVARVTAIEIGVEESFGQAAYFRQEFQA
jgi:6-pyruvoyl tetrahydropterin synthase/QueD family protein